MKKNPKQTILNAAIRLIEQRSSSLHEITVRDICTEAGVGVGLLNYHFQSKDNLIAACVQKIVGDVISRFQVRSASLPGLPPIEKLRILAKETCSYLAANKNISRISILTDLSQPGTNDNTAQTIQAFLPVVRQVCGEKAHEEEAVQKTHLFIYALQTTFLRSGISEQQPGFDFQNKLQREAMIDQVINLMFAS